MKKIICVLLISIMGLQLVGCGLNLANASDLMSNIKPGVVDPVDLDAEYVNSQLEFSVELLQEVVKAGEEESILISPTSAIMALAMTANGAEGVTKEEMQQVLSQGMPMEEFNTYLYSYLLKIKNDESVKMANSIWFREGFELKDEFLQTNADYFGADFYESAFDIGTAKDINRWVKERTDGMIDSIVEEKEMYSEMVLINALTFVEEWEEVYEKNQISDGIFITEDGKEHDVTMLQSVEYEYLEGDNVVGFKKHYKDRKYSFVALLPDEEISIWDYVEGLDGQTLLDILSNPNEEAVTVWMPKFSYSYANFLENELKAMGMDMAFSDRADFSGIGTSPNGPLFVNEVLQKTFITVDEQGTKAAAVTLVEEKCGCAPIERFVTLNRPFLYMIVDNETNLPIFMGILTKPTN